VNLRPSVTLFSSIRTFNIFFVSVGIYSTISDNKIFGEIRHRSRNRTKTPPLPPKSFGASLKRDHLCAFRYAQDIAIFCKELREIPGWAKTLCAGRLLEHIQKGAIQFIQEPFQNSSESSLSRDRLKGLVKSQR
jgi:hypothetical protein